MILALRIAFAVFVLGALAAAHIFLHRRLIRDASLPRWVSRSLYAGLAATGLGSLAAFLLGKGGESWAVVFPMWIALVLNLLLVMVPIELALWVRLKRRQSRDPQAPVVSEERRLFLSRALATTGAVAGGGLTVFGAYRAYEPAQITEVLVKLPGLPKALEGFTIAHLSDVHIGRVLKQRYLDALVDRANGVRPELVAITGDLVDGTTSDLGPIVSRLGNLKSRHGTYFVTGNHDYYSGADAWVKALRGFGVNVLRNHRVQIGDAAASFDLVGVDDWGHGGMDGDYDLESATFGRDPSRASVLLAHQPSNFDVVSKQGLGLQLSGHTHGGQMFPGTVFGQLIWGERNAGLSKLGESQLFVSRGCGFVGPAQRVGSPPEIAKIVLVPA